MAKKYTLPELPYAYEALEPVINREIMELHYKKHHNTYVTKLNEALEKYEKAASEEDLTKMIFLQSTIRFNGGGHINHSIFWTNLAPQSQGGGGEPKGELAAAVALRWGSFEAFKEVFNNIAAPIQGSGWCWLGYCEHSKQLMIETCANQDPLYATKGVVPLLGVDVWEHAYYLQYKNVRPDYLKAIWQVVNWENVSQRYSQCLEVCASCVK
ncbi:MAG: Superoxide dismutase [Mn] [Chlamydiae bacterium]|nr:Superoxide dismutase [Mn] [Chlamydiota bacterium]